MTEKKTVETLLSQLEDALEERQSNERRNKREFASRRDIEIERRLTDRRKDGKTPCSFTEPL